MMSDGTGTAAANDGGVLRGAERESPVPLHPQRLFFEFSSAEVRNERRHHRTMADSLSLRDSRRRSSQHHRYTELCTRPRHRQCHTPLFCCCSHLCDPPVLIPCVRSLTPFTSCIDREPLWRA